MNTNCIFFILLCFLLTYGNQLQAGSIDSSFGVDGTDTTSMDNGSNGDYESDAIYAVHLQPKEKIMVAGGSITFFAVAPYNGGESLGVNDVEGTSWSLIFPNPSTDFVFVETEPLVSNTSINNMLGQEIAHLQFSSEKKIPQLI